MANSHEKTKEVQQEPYGWKVYGVNTLFTGEYAEHDAKAEAKRIGGTCIAFPLYTRPQQPAQDEPVAWMYQCSADSSGPVLMQSKKDWAESGSGLWTETPLYTRPQSMTPLTDEQINLFINGRGEEGDDDYVEPTGDGFGLTDADLVKLVRRVEAAHGIGKKK